MSGTRNIGGDPNDPSYRYKMPRLVAKVEGRGNGIKTRLVNMVDIARSLHCDPEWVTKFFGTELGAQSKFEAKTDLSVVNGNHDLLTLNRLLDDFISKFVLCPTCRLPEINLSVNTRRQTILVDCRACGHNGPFPHMGHKLSTFIVKNPPKAKPKPKKELVGDKVAKAAAAAASEAPSNEEENGEEQQEQEAEEVDEMDPDGQILAQTQQMTVKLKDEDDDWATDTSKEAVEKRRQLALGDALKDLTVSGSEDTLVPDIRKLIGEKRPVAEIEATIRARAKSDGLGSERVLFALFDAAFDSNILKQIKVHAALFKKFISNSTSQKTLLGCVEKLVGEQSPELLKSLPHILKGFYDVDLLDEEVLLDWFDVPVPKYVDPPTHARLLKTARPFIEWLKNADEDSD